jgi:hypothetical protein
MKLFCRVLECNCNQLVGRKVGFQPSGAAPPGTPGLPPALRGYYFDEDNMKTFSNFFQLLFLLLLCGVLVPAQTPETKQFTKDGLVFNYPSGWSFNDSSNADAQDLTLGRADSDAQIKVFAFRPLITTPEKLAEAKRILVDKYVESTTKGLSDAGAKPESSPATIEISTLPAEGVRFAHRWAVNQEQRKSIGSLSGSDWWC